MSNQNQHKPGYKQTPLGWIPEAWRIKDLISVASVKRGRFSPRPRNDPKFYGGNIPFVQTSDITNSNGKVNSYTQTLNEEGLKVSVLFPAGTILMTIASNIGHSAILEIDMACPDSLVGIICKENIDKNYLNYFFSYNQKRIEYIAPGAQKNINIEFLEPLPIVYPEVGEQRKIATILSTWDEAIIKTQQLIAQLQQRNKGLMQQLLTDKDNWNEYRIGNLLKEVKRPVSWNDDELYDLISVRRRSGGAFFRESLYGKQILTKQLFTAEAGDFLISKMQIVHGASAVVPPELAGMKISGSYIAVHAKDDNVMDIIFFNWLSKTKWFYKLTYISSYGVHIEKMTFDFDDFKRRKIKLPATIEEQKRIVNILQAATEEVKMHEQKLAALQQQKKGLMQKLLTGEIRVN